MSHTDLLIVIDVQNGFVNDRSKHALPGVVAAITAAREGGVPIFFTRFINDEGSSWETLIGWKRLRTSPEIELHDEIADLAKPDEIVDKRSYSSFIGEIETHVSLTGARTVALCGIATDGCVLKTAVDLFESGVRPVILTDAVSSHAGDAVHEAGLMLLSRFIGREQLVTTEEWFKTRLSA
jgi:nicotinamidase-related amidase